MDSQRTVLIIDDNEVSRLTLTELLRKIDFKVESAEDGREGVRKAKRKKYDLVLLDIRMPGIDGAQVLRILKKHFDESGSRIPVLIVSGYLTKNVLIEFKKMGASGFLAKPFDPKKFYMAVNQVCPLSEKVV